jgi:ubiquinone/menaquinone biosynthesis C-methylase UbiE
MRRVGIASTSADPQFWRDDRRVEAEPEFRPDLYRGTAHFYDRFRVPYPAPLLDDLCRRTNATGRGRLLDLACGTGQLAFGLASRFAEIWAVDQEREAIDLARTNARARRVRNVRWMVGRAEDIAVDRDFDLVAVGNAFHRLQRRRVAESARRWLTSGGHFALVWSTSPWDGDEEWQRVLARTMRDWVEVAHAADRVPANLDQHLTDEPHAAVLTGAGFAVVGEHDFPTPHEWTIERVTGFLYSTSVLSKIALGSHAAAFERDLRDRLLRVAPDNVLRESIAFHYTLARLP